MVIVGVIIWAVASSNNNSKNSSAHDNTSSENNVYYQQQEEKNEVYFVDNSNLTNFQRELRENTKIPKQVEDENWIKEKESIINSVN